MYEDDLIDFFENIGASFTLLIPAGYIHFLLTAVVRCLLRIVPDSRKIGSGFSVGVIVAVEVQGRLGVMVLEFQIQEFLALRLEGFVHNQNSRGE